MVLSSEEIGFYRFSAVNREVTAHVRFTSMGVLSTAEQVYSAVLGNPMEVNGESCAYATNLSVLHTRSRKILNPFFPQMGIPL